MTTQAKKEAIKRRKHRLAKKKRRRLLKLESKTKLGRIPRRTVC